MKEQLSTRNNPVIILGDFNSNWFSKKSVIKRLAEEGSLKVYKPQADNLPTYTSSDSRLDWILISSELEFISYKVLPDKLSDHLMVVAEIQLMDMHEIKLKISETLEELEKSGDIVVTSVAPNVVINKFLDTIGDDISLFLDEDQYGAVLNSLNVLISGVKVDNRDFQTIIGLEKYELQNIFDVLNNQKNK